MNRVREKGAKLFLAMKAEKTLDNIQIIKSISFQNLFMLLKLWLVLKLTSKENSHLARERRML